jgi:hypothetical protein
MMELLWLGAHPRTPVEQFLCHAVEAAQVCSVPLWLYGGYALEAHLGRPLREHKDVDLLARAADAPMLTAALAGPGCEVRHESPGALTVYGSERCIADIVLAEEHPWGFSFLRSPSGIRLLPPGSLSDGPLVSLWGRSLRVVTLECLYVSKARSSFEAAEMPLEQKRQHDLTLISSRLPGAIIKGLESYCRPMTLSWPAISPGHGAARSPEISGWNRRVPNADSR